MSWSPDPHALRGRVAVVAGATRGAGRGIAAALGEAGATVVCTGRTTGSTRSEYNRPETIEETAALVTRLGGTGIAVAALAADPARARWNQRSVSSAELAHECGFTDVDGSRPDIWRYFDDSRAGERPADLWDYR
jgi:NAD(P)-dependent dehydrogenase (short-subunit alcohol dehydrogenase family)